MVERACLYLRARIIPLQRNLKRGRIRLPNHLQGVQMSFDISRGRDWNDTKHGSTLVFIGKNLPENQLRESFIACTEKINIKLQLDHCAQLSFFMDGGETLKKSLKLSALLAGIRVLLVLLWIFFPNISLRLQKSSLRPMKFGSSPTHTI